MEQPGRRAEFIKIHFFKVYSQMELNGTMLRELQDDPHNPCKESMNAIMALDNEKSGQKSLLICEFMNEREPAEYLAKFLRKHSQAHLAKLIEEFNKSEVLIPYVTSDSLPVRPSPYLRSGGSCRFQMETSPRGLCLIILNEMELAPEAQQLASVFCQMYFVLKVETKMTSLQIDKLFDEIAKSPEYKGYNALVTILIGHGGDGLFCGANWKYDTEDNIPIPHLIDKLAEDKCLNFKNKPKINIFNCCRDRSDGDILSQVPTTLLEKIIIYDKSWINNNINSTVIYACAEGQQSFFSGDGFTYFGRALSHTIAQFACEQSLDQLIKTLNRRLENDCVKQSPELIQYKNKWTLFFNPGRIKIN